MCFLLLYEFKPASEIFLLSIQPRSWGLKVVSQYRCSQEWTSEGHSSQVSFREHSGTIARTKNSCHRLFCLAVSVIPAFEKTPQPSCFIVVKWFLSLFHLHFYLANKPNKTTAVFQSGSCVVNVVETSLSPVSCSMWKMLLIHNFFSQLTTWKWNHSTFRLSPVSSFS